MNGKTDLIEKKVFFMNELLTRMITTLLYY